MPGGRHDLQLLDGFQHEEPFGNPWLWPIQMHRLQLPRPTQVSPSATFHPVCFDNSLTSCREDIISHHRASGETGQDAGWYNDPALNDRVNLEVKACRLPHRAPWTGSSVVPPPDQTTLAAARASISQSTPDEEDDDEHDEHDVPMPLPGIIAEAVNAIMPMIGHLYYRGDYQQNPNLKMWVDELQVRLDRIEDAQSFQEAVLRLQRLKGTVELGRNLLTTNRELLAFEATVQKIEELARDADREH